MSYESLRHFADSWGLLFMLVTWAGLALWAFRPGSRRRSREAAHSIFDESKNDER